MRRKIFYLLILTMVETIACQKTQDKAEATAVGENDIEGVWEFVSGEYVSPDTTIERTQADWNAIKIISDSHFATVGQKPNRPKFIMGESDKETVEAFNTFSANGGTYTILGSTYTEHLSYFLNPNRVNETASINYQLEQERLILTVEAGDVVWRETWKRLE
ncbi:MAG: hypothetical protein A3F83_01730 [Candidatus Glassbacteria bacterium RIFCSPLOWO2_12_FULL_58_11]|uniref:Uncharacterized protein n=1 Tax=Candidatus Glassbacteria bacterium RIFCSPLOWO2_12_FULL_58_11 TaxID=1817867 RepID=A0A1F5YKJ0_9BACT|nr:MAG: hypothetical protein A3F83_01730 [Candidatus Glassbacteria bacterium RIFCSPLOWO2_12_FULL_58_11]